MSAENADDELTHQIEEALYSQSPVPAKAVIRWMQAPSLESWGALSVLLFNHSQRIEPPLAIDRVCDFRREYYRRCLSEATEGGKYFPSRFIAGHEMQRWFKQLWNDSTVPRRFLDDLKTMLANLYLSASPEVRECIEVSVLEHLFETQEIAEFFSAWKDDPLLEAAYDSAMEWARDHPEEG